MYKNFRVKAIRFVNSSEPAENRISYDFTSNKGGKNVYKFASCGSKGWFTLIKSLRNDRFS